MSKTILANVTGWTPLIDCITKTHGHTTSAVFGRIWRYCQLSDGVCVERISCAYWQGGFDS